MIWVTLVLSMIAGYLVFWAGVISLIGFAGWKQIAERFPADRWPEEEEGVALSWQSGSIRTSRYNGVLKAVITAGGLYLRPVRMSPSTIRRFSSRGAPLFQRRRPSGMDLGWNWTAARR